MGRAITITNLDHSASDLRRLMSKQKGGAVVRRLMALALMLEGQSRSEAARQSGMERQTLRDWVHRYNAEGLAGLSSRVCPGPAPLLDEVQIAVLKVLVVYGPDPETDGVVRWRCIDLRVAIKRRFSVKVHKRTVAKWLRRLELTRLQPRPFHPKKDTPAQEAFKKLPPPEPRSFAGFGSRQRHRSVVSGRSQGRTKRFDRICLGADRLAPADGTRQSTRLRSYLRRDLRGLGAAIIMPAVNTEAMNLHLKEIATQVATGAHALHALLVCDGAGWHQPGTRLVVYPTTSL